MLGEVFCDVLEKLAFMFGEPVSREELPEPGPENVRAAMTFSGNMSGSLALAVPADMCVEIAANVLGMDPDDEIVASRGIDALKEVLNVVCGQVLTAIAGEEPIFDLSVPSVETLDPDGWNNLLNESTTAPFLVDDRPVLLQLSLEQPAK